MKFEFLGRAIRRFATTDYSELFGHFRETAQIAVDHYYGTDGRENHPLKRLWFELDIIWCYFRYGADYDDYRDYKFYIKRGRERRRYVTAFKKRKIMYKFQNQEVYDNIENKHLFNTRYAPFIQRKWISSTTSTKDEILAFIGEHGKVIAKVTDSGKGVGINIIHAGNQAEIDELFAEIDKKRIFVIEELIENAPELKAVNPSSLNTLRVVTAIDAKGEIHILGISLRMGSGGSFVDNLSSGGIMCNVNPEHGIIDSWGITKTTAVHIKHPDTGVVFPGFQIPRWNEVLEFIDKVASFDKKVRYVGWDLAILPDRIELIEGNCRPGGDTTQYFSGNGIIPTLKSYL